jgi:hypothetical protein
MYNKKKNSFTIKKKHLQFNYLLAVMNMSTHYVFKKIIKNMNKLEPLKQWFSNGWIMSIHEHGQKLWGGTLFEKF